MKFGRLTIPFIWVALFFACNTDKKSEQRTEHLEEPNAVAFSCYPDILYRDDTLYVKMAIPHPEQLAVLDPDSLWFDLQPAQSLAQPLIPHEEFRRLSHFQIIPAQTKGIRWVDGKPESLLIFTKTGFYRIYLGDNLETEFENALVFESKIYYIDKVKEK